MMPYSIHVAVILTVCLGFYKLLLGKQTYYRLNRVILLACLAASFLLPLIRVPQQFAIFTNKPVVSRVYAEVINTAKTTPVNVTDKAVDSINAIQWLEWMYWFAAAAFGINFLIQASILLYQSYKNESIDDGRYKIIELDTNKAPCSFGNYIFINPAKYDWDTYNRIILHEKIHVRERHSIDLIICELMLVFQWFNPFAWFYRKAVEDNLEFLTDDTVVHEHKVDMIAYQWSLLQVSVPNYAVRVATSYNQSLLRKRILMMDAKRSNVHTLWKYIMLLPVMISLVLLFNPTVAQPDIIVTKPIIDQEPQNAQKTPASTLPANKLPVKEKTKNVAVTAVDTSRRLGKSSTDTTRAHIYEKTVDNLLILQSYGIDIDYVKGLKDIGYSNLTLTDVRQLHSRGITVAYIQGFADLGCRLTIPDVIALHSRGITPEYPKTFVDNGYKDLTANDLIKLQSHGIKAGPKPF